MSGTTVDTQDMVIVHRVFRREFGMAPDLVGSVAEGDTERAAVVASHLKNIIFGLHHHHEGEDELLWPVLLAKAAPRQELIHQMESEHQAMSEALRRVEAVLPAWEQHARRSDGDQLSAGLREAGAILLQHLDEEEAEILPLVREALTVEEWEALGKRGSEAFENKEKMMLFLGAILEDASPQEQGRKKYVQYTDRLRTGVVRKAS